MLPRRSLKFVIAVSLLVALLQGAQGALERLGAETLPRPVDGTALQLLDQLTVSPDDTAGGYDRDRFGPGWATTTGGCDTRAQVLVAESATPAVVQPGCQVTAGEWTSPYDGHTTTSPGDLEVDHLVPLAEAWASGAGAWTQADREAFANDTDHPDALVAVSASVNRSKSDRDPTDWLPPNQSAWCWYATAWVTQKTAWDLTADEAEHQALAEVLTSCPPAEVTLP